jgi:uncharacterized protein YjbJ (UPF0337 family)
MRVVVGAGHKAAFEKVPVPCKHIQKKTREPDQSGTSSAMQRCLSEAQSIEKESVMGSTTDKIKGTANEAMGKAKQGIGEATGNERLEGEGVIQEVKGKGQKAVGDAKDATKDAINRAAAAANKKL